MLDSRFSLEFDPGDDPQLLRERISELEEQVSNLKRLDETISRNSRLFEALLAASQEGVALTRPDGTIIRVINSILGYGRTGASGVSIFDLIHPDDRAMVRKSYFDLRNGERQVLQELRMIAVDGSIVRIESTVTNLLDDPDVMAIVHNYRDVTRRTEAEIAALEFAAAMEFAPFALFSKDTEGTILSWSPGAERSYGYTTEEMIGQNVWKLVPEDLQSEETSLRRIVLEKATPVGPLHTVRKHKDGTHMPVELTLAPLLRNGQVRGVVHFSQTG